MYGHRGWDAKKGSDGSNGGNGDQGVLDRVVAETPIAVIDIETTGLTPGADRVVELSVVRREPGKQWQLVFDSLIRPLRPMASTEIHGITFEDVADAPTFKEVHGQILEALSGCVVASHNVHFDMRFLAYELADAGFSVIPPHFCLMHLRPMLGIGNRCSLEDACREHGIDYISAHISSTDVLAASRLFDIYLEEMGKRDVNTFADVGKLKQLQFVQSFVFPPIDSKKIPQSQTGRGLKSRRARIAAATEQTAAGDGTSPNQSNKELGIYWDNLRAVLSDLVVTNDEIALLEKKQKELHLSPEQVRVLHARIFISVLSQFVDDQWLDDQERQTLRRLYRCLAKLGWAPGQ